MGLWVAVVNQDALPAHWGPPEPPWGWRLNMTGWGEEHSGVASLCLRRFLSQIKIEDHTKGEGEEVLMTVWVCGSSCDCSDQEVRAVISKALLCSHLNRGQKNPVKYQREGVREVWKWNNGLHNSQMAPFLSLSPACPTVREKALLPPTLRPLSCLVSTTGRAEKGTPSWSADTHEGWTWSEILSETGRVAFSSHTQSKNIKFPLVGMRRARYSSNPRCMVMWLVPSPVPFWDEVILITRPSMWQRIVVQVGLVWKS